MTTVNFLPTLDSALNVGPTFTNFGFLSRPYGLIRGPTFINFWKIFEKKIKE